MRVVSPITYRVAKFGNDPVEFPEVTPSALLGFHVKGIDCFEHRSELAELFAVRQFTASRLTDCTFDSRDIRLQTGEVVAADFFNQLAQSAERGKQVLMRVQEFILAFHVVGMANTA
jgi:hypothetical protein